jgi:hypothetical protein
MALYTVTATDPSLSVLGLPTEVRNNLDAKAALAIYHEFSGRKLRDITIIEYGGSKISIADLERAASKDSGEANA